MDHLTSAQVEELRAAIMGEIAALQGQSRSATGEASAVDEAVEQQDAAAQESARLNAVAQADRAAARLAQLRAALARMEDGSYGLCEESEEEIPFARLRAEPTTRYTVEALEQLGLDAPQGARSGDDDRSAY
mgnify:CR=1 FL=1